MFCPNCGVQLPDDAKFCPGCGTKITSDGPSQQTQPSYQPTGQQGYQNPYAGNNLNSEIPMKWFKFLIYFSLWAGAVVSLSSGILSVTGLTYSVYGNGTTASFVYSCYGIGLKVLDVIYGILSIAIAVFFIYTRFRLAQFRKDGPLCLYIIYGAEIVVSVVYLIGVSLITGVNAISSDTVSSIVTGIIMIIINRIYFRKRSHMFVN